MQVAWLGRGEGEEAEEEELPALDPKALKAIVKEGGKKGAEVAGAEVVQGMVRGGLG